MTLPTRRDTRSAGWLAGGLLGLVLLCYTCTLPWHDPDFRVDWWTRIVMGLCGAALLVLTVRQTRMTDGGVRVTVGMLGLSVLLYPSLLALSAAGIGGTAVAIAARSWHAVALTLVQLAPVLAAGQVTGRSIRGWSVAVLAVSASNFVLFGFVVLVPDSPAVAVLGPLATLLWLGSFALPPIATWTAVRGTSGETRLRAIVAALASLLPAMVIAWCSALDVIGKAAGLSTDGGVLALMIGFSVGTLGGGGLALAATAASVTLPRPRSVLTILNLVVGITIAIAGSVAAVAASAAQLPGGWAVTVGAAVAVAVGLPWLRLHAWIARVIDPAAELRHELARLGDVAEGDQRATVLHVLRRLVDDPALVLLYRVDDQSWEGTDERPAVPEPGDAALAGQDDAQPFVLVRAGSAATNRLLALGDCTALLRPALLEARASWAGRRARQAAEQERRRLGQNLHDGLQGRLLGLALQLQLSGREVDDPATRLLLDDTVGTLRGLVDDVRALGGGNTPGLLVDHGLRPALSTLFRPLGPLVDLDLPEVRYPAEVEETVYFVVGEAMANALKHAGAGRIGVQLSDEEPGRVTITVSDDGKGGADPRLGTGLRGLSERVAAQGGVLVVRAGAPRGTVVEAVLPCA